MASLWASHASLLDQGYALWLQTPGWEWPGVSPRGFLAGVTGAEPLCLDVHGELRSLVSTTVSGVCYTLSKYSLNE